MSAPPNTRPLPSMTDERWDDAAHVARYGLHAGHPHSGRCGGCGLEIVGESVRRGPWIYCGDKCAAPYETTVRYCGCGALAGECECVDLVVEALSVPQIKVGSAMCGGGVR